MTPSMMALQSPHRDVLEAKPDSDDSKARLVEELQSRGRAAVGAKSWMDAKLLYEKALTVCQQGEKMAILESNLSLAYKSMGSFEDARQCAQRATEADPAYLKGWWRLGQALQSLHRSQEALEALAKAKEIEPTNKALTKEYEKVQKKVEEEARLMKEMPPPVEEQPEAETKKKTTTTTKVTNTKPKTTTEKKDDKMDIGDDNIFSKSDAVRGYKVVNGKKTSYFHNELSDEAKELIGDIAPKKLEIPASSNSNTPASGGSAWNKAGTWEEKDVTKWAKGSLEKQVLQTTYTFPDSSPAPGSLVTVTKISKLDGSASFAMARGKKRYIYEFLLKLDWQVSNDSGLECKGSFAIPDIDGTIDLGEGYEIHEFTIDSVSDTQVRPLLDRFVHRGGFQEALNESIDDWVRLFKNEY
jgi:tetratricopeptide (TPR) repeat protein